MSLFRRRDGIGRRAGFKIQWWQHRIGSTPIAGTKSLEDCFSAGSKNKSGSVSDPLVFIFISVSLAFRLIFRDYRFAVVVIAVGAHSVRNFRFATL